ncbi:hypothetical protein H7F33_05565 [Pedobacter sp. PAMC26386]|nr:hypothetical protein H7F33_05565 [Pedobacter sp. PAMC26386]
MKKIYLKTLEKFKELPEIKFVDKDRAQIDTSERPAVKFPCALISISLPKRKNLAADLQLCACTISIRIAFERFADSSNLSPQARLNLALEYYDIVERVEALFQGYTDAEMNPWECTSSIEEVRPDLDVMRLSFSTSFTKLVI